MRWEQLFADLDARFEELADQQLLAELADRQRVATGALPLTSRIGGALGQPLRMRTTAGATITGALRKVGPDWALLVEAPGREALINLRAVTGIEGLTAVTAVAVGGVALRLDLRHMLRGLARDRSPVSLTVPGAPSSLPGTGTELTGTIDRVGADFLEMAQHAAWEPRRAGGVRSVVAIPLAAVVVVRSQPLG